MKCPICGASEDRLLFEQVDQTTKRWKLKNSEPYRCDDWEEPIDEESAFEQYIVCKNCKSRIRSKYNCTTMKVETYQGGLNYDQVAED